VGGYAPERYGISFSWPQHYKPADGTGDRIQQRLPIHRIVRWLDFRQIQWPALALGVAFGLPRGPYGSVQDARPTAQPFGRGGPFTVVFDGRQFRQALDLGIIAPPFVISNGRSVELVMVVWR
jgi:hypothetical protein